MQSTGLALSAKELWLRVPLRGALAGSLLAGLWSQLALVVTGILTARSLGPTDRGYWGLLVLLPAVLQQVGTFGLPLATTYFIASDRTRESAVLRLIRWPAISQAVVLAAVQAVVLWFVLDGQPDKVRTAGAATLLLLLATLADMYGKAILQGEGRYTALNVFRTSVVTLSLVGVVTLWAAGHATLVSIALVWVAANLIGGGATLAVAVVHRPKSSAQSAVSRREMISYGLRGWLGSVSPVETFRLDQALVGLFLEPLQLGLYIAALAFTNLPALISRSIGLIAFPRIASDASGERRGMIRRYFWLSAILMGGSVAALEVGAGWMVPFFFGEAFTDAVTMTRILLIGAFLYGLRRVLSDSASGAGATGLASIAELTSWGVLLPLFAVLTPIFGAEGVASALTIAYATSLATLIVLLRRSGALESDLAVPESPLTPPASSDAAP
jgi:O-antigen/teichoic acid export membrane protein